MLKAILSVIAGYAAYFTVLFCSFTTLYLSIGAQRAFEPLTYNVSGLWIGSSIVVSLIAAAIGGLVCTLIARRAGPPRALAGIILGLGLLAAVLSLAAPRQDPGPRLDTTANIEAMTKAKMPLWIQIVNPIISAATVLAVARHRK